MPRNVDAIIRELSPARRKKVEARAAELLAEEMTLRQLRNAHHKTQVELASLLGIGQEAVSRLEQRSDLLLSTLNEYIKAMGGKLELVASFPDRHPVVVTGFSAMTGTQRRRDPARAVGRRARSKKSARRASEHQGDETHI
jgi:transcriptional regulator with XRE-family HTH domain